MTPSQYRLEGRVRPGHSTPNVEARRKRGPPRSDPETTGNQANRAALPTNVVIGPAVCTRAWLIGGGPWFESRIAH
jgi:hypothetical protein